MRTAATFVALGVAIAGIFTANGQSNQAATVTCGQQTYRDQCHVTWDFPVSSNAFYWVQQLDPMSGKWQGLGHVADGTAAQASRSAPVEPGYLYRVLSCSDKEAKTNCIGSTMVWAPFIEPPERVDLIPSQVPAIHPGRSFKGYVGAVSKEANWLAQVSQYNVYQLINAISYTNIAELPDMTIPADIRAMQAQDVTPIDTVQFNVWATFLEEQGRPLNFPTVAPFPRPPHEHPERAEHQTQKNGKQ